jgi:hypothetical protein
MLSLVAQEVALVATASAGTCDRCAGPLYDDARTDDALITRCGACVEFSWENAVATQQAASRAALAASRVSPRKLSAIR